MADQAIEQIKQRLDIVEFLQEYLRLQKAGSNWRSTCPFHHEKTPSFMVSQDKQIWHCFGCSKGGDVFTFLQEIDGIDFAEALKILAQRTGVTLERYQPEQTSRKADLISVVELAVQYYQNCLQTEATATQAREYLTKRGITEATQKQFGLGYSPELWDGLLRFLQAKGIALTDQLAAGLLIRKDTTGERYYDRFRGRIMIPLHTVNGLAVGFTARSLEANPTGGKYINSPQSALYDKSRLVYGLHLAKQSIRQLNAAIVVEGNIDVITAHQAGFRNTVALSGTAFTAEQLILLKRYSSNILLALDMDAAGVEATRRSVSLALQQGMNIRVINLPQNFKDPDECIRHDPQLFKQAIRDALHIIDYFMIVGEQRLDLTKVEHKKRYAQALIPYLRWLIDPVEQSHFIQRLAEKLNVDPGSIRQQLKPMESYLSTRPSHSNAANPAPERDRSIGLSEYMMALVVALPEQMTYFSEYLDLAYLTEPGAIELYSQLLDHYNKTGEFTVEGYLALHPADRPYLTTLSLLKDHQLAEYDTTALLHEAIQTIRSLQRNYIQRRLQQLTKDVQQAEQTGDAVRATLLLQESHLLTQQLTELLS